jgi:hypothetical protein
MRIGRGAHPLGASINSSANAAAVFAKNVLGGLRHCDDVQPFMSCKNLTFRPSRRANARGSTLVLCPIGSLFGSTSRGLVQFALPMRCGQRCRHQRRDRFS